MSVNSVAHWYGMWSVNIAACTVTTTTQACCSVSNQILSVIVIPALLHSITPAGRHRRWSTIYGYT